MTTIYYSPEQFGLTTVGEVERRGGYEFDTFVVWQANSDGRLWWAADSGCSCPVPFEGVSFADGLTEVHTFQELIDAINTWRNEYPDDTSKHSWDGEIGSLLIKAREVANFEQAQLPGATS